MSETVVMLSKQFYRPSVRPIDALKAWSSASDGACEAIAAALQPHIPAGFRGRIEISIDNGSVLPHNIAVTGRPSQRSK